MAAFRQRVPRPERHRPGPPPPWATLSPEQRHSIPLSLVAQVLDEVSLDQVPTAAVLAPIFERDGEATILFIRRSLALKRDPGHVAFPGGRIDPGESIAEAALREAEEEVALGPDLVGSVAVIDTFRQGGSGELVAACVALLSDEPRLAPSAEEVEAVFAVPLAALLADGVAWSEQWEGLGPDDRSVYFFSAPEFFGDDLLWGLTARIVWELLERLAISLASALLGE